VNHILVNASDKFKLERQNAMDRVPPGYTGPALGIWNGEEFVYTQDAHGGWWDYAKLFWRYGTAPVRAVAAMKASVGRFLRMYDDDVFPWKDLGEQIEALGLLEDTSITGEQLLKQKGVGDLFAQELVQASTSSCTLTTTGRMNADKLQESTMPKTLEPSMAWRHLCV
jgi:prenylcysteine oxidase/farnesylcysteine lyase